MRSLFWDDPGMEIRAAVLADAPAMGRLMVVTWLSAHRGQMPDEAWQKRVEEWTPHVSARGWARLLSEVEAGDRPRTVLLVVEHDDELEALALGGPADEDARDVTAQLDALYVLPGRQGRGIGRLLLRRMAEELAGRGFARLHVGVLSANLPARAFYEAMGGEEIGQRTFDEEGHLLPGCVYEWSDLGELRSSS